MTEQQPHVRPGAGTNAAEETGFGDDARATAGNEAELDGAVDPAQPADEASSPG